MAFHHAFERMLALLGVRMRLRSFYWAYGTAELQSCVKTLHAFVDDAIAASDDPAHRLAFDLFVDRVCGFVGSYFVTLRGRVDALVFAGGIGEHSDRLRAAVVDQCACLGFAVDPEANARKLVDVVQDIGSPAGGPDRRVLVCQTDEQFEMARAAAEDPALWVEDGDDTPDLTLLRVMSGEAH